MCVLIFVLMLSTLTPYVMIFANGFAEGHEAAMKKDGGAKATAAVEREADALAGAKTLSHDTMLSEIDQSRDAHRVGAWRCAYMALHDER